MYALREVPPDPASFGEPKMLSRTPHARQADFLNLTCEEALYGGAAGGGKTDALLMWLAEGVNTPGYSGILFRRTFAQLEKSNDSPITKSFEMYRELGGRYNKSKHKWTFPSGATIEFGHMQHETSVMDYQGAAYHRVAFDELTQFTENQYTYLFSRMRRRKEFPIRMGFRASANPGGVGHIWVKTRFVTKEAESAIRGLNPRQPSPSGLVLWPTEKRAFVPARLADNPSLDIEDYVERMLGNLSELHKQQLVNGDWSAVTGAQIDSAWFRRYEVAGDAIWMLDDELKRSRMVDQRMCQRFATIDTAGSSKQKADEKKGKNASYSALAIWDRSGRDLMLRHVCRGKWDWPQLKATMIGTLKEWKVGRTYVENQTVGGALAQEIQGAGLQAEAINCQLPGMNQRGSNDSAKYERAVASGMFDLMRARNFHLPVLSSNTKWLPDYEAELTSWTGADGEQSDQVDITSYACWLSRRASLPTKGLIK
jgi:hypothetical protein